MRHFVLGLIVGLAILPLAVLLAGSLGLLATGSTATPPAWETAFARHALHTAAAHRAPRLRNPVTITDSTLRAGMKFYRGQCSGCHGLPGQEFPAGLYPEPPKFPSHPPKLPDWQLYWIVKHGVRYSGMFAWNDPAEDAKIWTVVTFLTQIDSLPPPIAAEWHEPPPQS